MYKEILSIIMILTSIANADIYSGSIYDDIDASNISIDLNSSLSSSPINTLVNFDEFNKTTTVTKTVGGTIKYNDFNITNATSKRQLMRIIADSASGRGNAIIKKMSESDIDFSRYSMDDLDDLTLENLKTVYTNSRRINELQKIQDSTTTLLNTYGSQSTIKCYIKRNLSPSFYCPLSGKDRSYYTGGIANTSQDDAMKECAEYCKTPQTCVSKGILGFTDKDPETIINATAPTNINMQISNKQMLKSLEIFIKGNANEQHVYMSISGVIDSKTIILLDNYDISLKDTIQSIIFPLGLKDYSSIKVSFLTPYTFSIIRKQKTLITQPGSVTISKAVLHYEGEKYWFCPAKQFVKNRRYCTNGTIKSEIVGGSPVLLCITQADQLRESVYGAFYSENNCNKQCFTEDDCVPTYRHLSGGITSSIYNVDYGCMSGLDNASCTRQLCKEKIFNNVMPNKEIVFYNDTVKETTVENGQTIKGKYRPIYNVSAEMTTNNNEEEKKKLMVTVSKDMAYRAMITNRTYVISGKKLKDVYPLQTKATKIGGNGVTIEYLPPSDTFNTGLTSYIYFISANYYNYKEEKTVYEPITDSAPRTFRSINYTILDGIGGLKLFYIKDKVKIILMRDVNNSTITDYSSPTDIKKMLGNNGQLVLYDTSSMAPLVSSYTFTSNKYKYDYLISNAYLEKANSIDGTSLKSQVTEKGQIYKYYNGGVSKTGGNVFKYDIYEIVSKTRLSYQDIINKIEDKSIHFAYSSAFSRKYTRDIRGHANISFDNNIIKIYILGKSNKITAVGEFTPEFGDEGKEAFVFNFLYKNN